MARFVTRVRTPLAPEAAFAYMADLTNFARWDPGVRRAEAVTTSEPGLGAEFDVEVNGIPRPLLLRYRLTTYRHPHEVVAEATSKRLHSLDRITVVPDDSTGSLVTYDAELNLRGVPSVFDPFLSMVFGRIGRQAEQGLMKALDGQRVG